MILTVVLLAVLLVAVGVVAGLLWWRTNLLWGRTQRQESDLLAMVEVVASLPKERAPGPVSWWDGVQRKSVLVHLVDERTIRGVVSQICPDGVLLVSAEYLEDGGGRVEMAGQVFVPSERVAFAQQEPGRRPRQATKR